MATAKKHAESETGVKNVTYDLMSVLTNKLQGIAAIEEYKKDAQGDQEAMQCFEDIQKHEREDVDKLRDLVAQRLKGQAA